MKPIVALDRVSKRFLGAKQRRAPLYRQIGQFVKESLSSGQRLGLDQVSLEIQPGQVVGIVGANGAGKSTLLRVLCGIYAPSEGTCRVEGRVACHFGGEAGLAPTLPVADNMLLFGAMLGMTRTETITSFTAILDLAELPGEEGTRLEHLSFGRQQRLFFGVMLRAMQLGKADLFLFDEWLAGADRHYQDRGERLLKSTRHARQTLILSSHDIDRLKRLCDVAIHLEEGRVRDMGPAGEVLDRYLASTTETGDRAAGPV